MIKSPLTGKKNTRLLNQIDCQKIILKYKELLEIDVSSFFKGIENICLYECLDTKYRFFYPYTSEGNAKFYEDLQKNEWYYMPWKWEHKQAKKLINKSQKVLEIGCAQGNFLQKISSELEVEATGIELNTEAVKIGKKNGLNIYNEMIDVHSTKKKEYYDTICMFEVLEHISDVKSFLNETLKCLKKGGQLIIAVPNNDSFIKYDNENNILNLPPHHMGHWKKNSLKSLCKLFNLKLTSTLYEPIQEYHKQWHNNIINNRLTNLKNKEFIQQIYKLLPSFLKWRFNILLKKIIILITSKKGHTILCSFTKL